MTPLYSQSVMKRPKQQKPAAIPSFAIESSIHEQIARARIQPKPGGRNGRLLASTVLEQNLNSDRLWAFYGDGEAVMIAYINRNGYSKFQSS
jgi:hypothetical protein